LTVNGDLTLTAGYLNTQSNTITLGGNLSGESSSKRVWGNLGSTKSLALNQTSTFGNLGLSVTSGGQAMGSTQVIRHLGSGLTIGTANSILRQYEIHPTTNTGLSATLVVSYEDDELNGLTEANLKLYRKPTAGTYTKQVASVVNADANTLTMSNIVAFSDWTASDNNAILPVTILSLTGKQIGKDHLISWQVGTEVNFAHYVVETSIDGKQFNEVGQVQGEGKKNYQFSNLQATSTYYRLKLVDLDGSVEYSPVIKIGSKTDNKLSFYPNPVKDQLTVVLEANVSAQLVNSIGQVVWTGSLEAGINTILVGQFVQGVYSLVVEGKGYQIIK
jgi:hypothetical protein